MNRILVDLHYFPSLEFFAAIQGMGELIFSPEDLYQRQSYYNRTTIRLANKIETLSVPIVGRRPRVANELIRIDFTQDWQKIHLRGIQSGYGKAPFFEFYFPYFESLFSQKRGSLWDLNWEILTICLKLVGSSAKMRVLEKGSNTTGIMDIRGQISPEKHFSEQTFYQPEPYFQLFGLDFDPNLSILDLLFCEGPAAKSILLKSAKKD
jgi:hypothetical protein